MSLRPSFQFYPADWRNNSKLRRCSHAARGAWIEIMCVLHDSDDYGLVKWPLDELAHAAGTPLKLARELADKGVLKGCDSGKCVAYTYTPRSGRSEGPTVTLVAEQDGPLWFSSRMIRDEYVRTKRGEKPTLGESPITSPKPTIGEDIGPRTRAPSSSSSSSTSEDKSSLRSDSSDFALKPEDQPAASRPLKARKQPRNADEFRDDFDVWYAVYPRREARGDAEKAYRAARKSGVTAERLLVAAKRYAESRQSEDAKFTKLPATWLNGKCWLDEPAQPALKPNGANGHGAYQPTGIIGWSDRLRAWQATIAEDRKAPLDCWPPSWGPPDGSMVPPELKPEYERIRGQVMRH